MLLGWNSTQDCVLGELGYCHDICPVLAFNVKRNVKFPTLTFGP